MVSLVCETHYGSRLVKMVKIMQRMIVNYGIRATIVQYDLVCEDDEVNHSEL